MRFLLFLINGGILGLLTFICQNLLNNFLNLFTKYSQFFSSLIIIIPFVFLNYYSQKKIIFKKKGSISLFFGTNLLIMLLVSTLTQLLEFFSSLTFYYDGYKINLCFIISALTIAPLSFFLKKKYVFNA